MARERGTRPPRLGFSNVFPSLYGGNMIEVGIESAARQVKAAKIAKDRATFDDKFFGPLHPDEAARRAKRAVKVAAGLAPSTKLADTTPFGYVCLKLLGTDGLWAFSKPLKLHGRRLRLPLDGAMPLAPSPDAHAARRQGLAGLSGRVQETSFNQTCRCPPSLLGRRGHQHGSGAQRRRHHRHGDSAQVFDLRQAQRPARRAQHPD